MELLEVKATLSVTDEGEVAGVAWPFGSADSVGDVITKGAFNIPLADMPILFNHDPSDLIGTWTEVKETDEGLVVKGKLHMDRPRARSILAMVKGKIADGLSIGFRTKASTKRARGRLITALDVLETSIVRNPSHPRARITSAKSMNVAVAIAEAITRATAAFATTR
ncbi:MAG TPA: HK97 family phage prohead protease [Nitrobacter sp.]|nr:HK97 family phage prohead protease [Nitrobacter sp.]